MLAAAFMLLSVASAGARPRAGAVRLLLTPLLDEHWLGSRRGRVRVVTSAVHRPTSRSCTDYLIPRYGEGLVQPKPFSDLRSLTSWMTASLEARLSSLLRHYEDAQREQGNPIRWLRTEELKGLLEDDDSDVKVILVDVRDKAEQRVSVLKGALSPARLDELLKSTGVPSGYSTSDEVPRVELGRTLLVPYCTAGVRSAAFGWRLAAKYPEWAPYIRNGEGIVRATYVMPEYAVDPLTGVAVRRVHVFGETWNLAAPSFETVQFSRWQRLAHAWSHLSSRRP